VRILLGDSAQVQILRGLLIIPIAASFQKARHRRSGTFAAESIRLCGRRLRRTRSRKAKAKNTEGK